MASLLFDASRNVLGEERELGQRLDDDMRELEQAQIRLLYHLANVLRRLPAGSPEFSRLQVDFAELKAVFLRNEPLRRAVIAAARACRH